MKGVMNFEENVDLFGGMVPHCSRLCHSCLQSGPETRAETKMVSQTILYSAAIIHSQTSGNAEADLYPETNLHAEADLHSQTHANADAHPNEFTGCEECGHADHKMARR